MTPDPKPMWRCKGCGATFPSIPHDEDVELCSQCVIVEQQGQRIADLEQRLAKALDICDRQRDTVHDLVEEKASAERRGAEREREAIVELLNTETIPYSERFQEGFMHAVRMIQRRAQGGSDAR